MLSLVVPPATATTTNVIDPFILSWNGEKPLQEWLLHLGGYWSTATATNTGTNTATAYVCIFIFTFIFYFYICCIIKNIIHTLHIPIKLINISFKPLHTPIKLNNISFIPSNFSPYLLTLSSSQYFIQ